MSFGAFVFNNKCKLEKLQSGVDEWQELVYNSPIELKCRMETESHMVRGNTENNLEILDVYFVPYRGIAEDDKIDGKLVRHVVAITGLDGKFLYNLVYFK